MKSFALGSSNENPNVSKDVEKFFPQLDPPWRLKLPLYSLKLVVRFSFSQFLGSGDEILEFLESLLFDRDVQSLTKSDTANFERPPCKETCDGSSHRKQIVFRNCFAISPEIENNDAREARSNYFLFGIRNSKHGEDLIWNLTKSRRNSPRNFQSSRLLHIYAARAIICDYSVYLYTRINLFVRVIRCFTFEFICLYDISESFQSLSLSLFMTQLHSLAE